MYCTNNIYFVQKMRFILAVVATVVLAAVVSAGGYGKGHGGKVLVIKISSLNPIVSFS